MKVLANELYNILSDMDNADYNEAQETDMENLLNDLELLNEHGNGALLNAIKALVEEL